jgi:hypothetical protein
LGNAGTDGEPEGLIFKRYFQLLDRKQANPTVGCGFIPCTQRCFWLGYQWEVTESSRAEDR